MKQLLPPIVLLTCLGGMALLRRFWPLAVFLQPPWAWVGLIPLLAGAALIAAALRRFKEARTTIKPFREARRLVTDGVCRYIRNPMYLGEVLILLGAWILMGALSPVVGVAAFAVIADRWFVRAEEEMFFGKFGQEYQDYYRSTRRWI